MKPVPEPAGVLHPSPPPGAANAVHGHHTPDLVRCGSIPGAVPVPVEREVGEHTCQTVTGGRAGKPMPARVALGGPYFRCGAESEVHACGYAHEAPAAFVAGAEELFDGGDFDLLPDDMGGGRERSGRSR
ncbi:hypothetical protein [Streptomyces sp. NPDC057325]|uniref:hypothetical protein n=1 Tax=unclassified Streptomyces TaxID=2593676 RepID=UPI00362FF818